MTALQHRSGRRKPDGFYRSVADLYEGHVLAGGNRPSAAIAEKWGVPRNTAKAWVRRARALGLLERSTWTLYRCRCCPLHCPDGGRENGSHR